MYIPFHVDKKGQQFDAQVVYLPEQRHLGENCGIFSVIAFMHISMKFEDS